MLSYNREDFQGEQKLLPELACLVYCHGLRARVPGIAEHTHPRCYEIFWMERGSVSWWTGSETHTLSAGQVYINLPGEKHGSVGGAMQPCSYYFLQLEPRPDGTLPGLEAADARALLRALENFSARCFAAGPEVPRCFAELLHEAREPRPLRTTRARALLHQLLCAVARESAGPPSGEAGPTRAVQLALDYIGANLGQELSVQELAQVAGLSTGHFRSRFRAETGFTPGSYLTRRRIEAAKELLSSPDACVSEIGLHLGFSSSQYFATVFRKVEGLSPSQYQRDCLAGGPQLSLAQR